MFISRIFIVVGVMRKTSHSTHAKPLPRDLNQKWIQKRFCHYKFDWRRWKLIKKAVKRNEKKYEIAAPLISGVIAQAYARNPNRVVPKRGMSPPEHRDSARAPNTSACPQHKRKPPPRAQAQGDAAGRVHPAANPPALTAPNQHVLLLYANSNQYFME